MDEPEDTIPRSFRLSKTHDDFLMSVHPNLNEAERICLDTLIQQQSRRRLKNWNNSIILISLGLIFFIFSTITSNVLTSVLTLLFGIFLAAYGIIMGVLHIEI